MSKLSIGHHGIEIENHEKDNVMTVGVQLAFVLCGVSISLLLFSSVTWIKILGAIILTGTFIIILSVYISHNIKSPELLQSERYRLEKQKIEMGMLDSKGDKATIPATSYQLIETSPKPITTDIKGDNEEII